MRLFSRKPIKSGGTHIPEQPVNDRGRRPLTANDLAGWLQAAEQRQSGIVPSIYDIEQTLQHLERAFPIEVAATRRQLRWMFNKASAKHNLVWETPYR
jgi:hypothetical protein